MVLLLLSCTYLIYRLATTRLINNNSNNSIRAFGDRTRERIVVGRNNVTFFFFFKFFFTFRLSLLLLL